jgi:3-methyladenine DNA glycosylase/8-oxoguanine DNA glycosylase
MVPVDPIIRAWDPGRPVDPRGTLAVHRRGAADPTHRTTPDGAVWRTARTTDGPATVRLSARRADGVVEAQAWGPGAAWVLDAVPAWLGDADDGDGFDPGHPVLRRVRTRTRAWRIGRTGLVMEALVPAVLEQKVTGAEARRGWRTLLARFGTPAPGPAPAGMRVVPTPTEWAAVPSWEWHRAGVGPQRARTAVRAALVAARLEEVAGMPVEEADRRLRSVPGVGAWTAAEVRQRALGDVDAVSVGDFHLCRQVGWVLAGEERADDARMLELLEPYRGQRYRVCRLVELSGLAPERRGPRLAPRDFRAI